MLCIALAVALATLRVVDCKGTPVAWIVSSTTSALAVWFSHPSVFVVGASFALLALAVWQQRLNLRG